MAAPIRRERTHTKDSTRGGPYQFVNSLVTGVSSFMSSLLNSNSTSIKDTANKSHLHKQPDLDRRFLPQPSNTSIPSSHYSRPSSLLPSYKDKGLNRSHRTADIEASQDYRTSLTRSPFRSQALPVQPLQNLQSKAHNSFASHNPYESYLSIPSTTLNYERFGSRSFAHPVNKQSTSHVSLANLNPHFENHPYDSRKSNSFVETISSKDARTATNKFLPRSSVSVIHKIDKRMSNISSSSYHKPLRFPTHASKIPPEQLKNAYMRSNPHRYSVHLKKTMFSDHTRDEARPEKPQYSSTNAKSGFDLFPSKSILQSSESIYSKPIETANEIVTPSLLAKPTTPLLATSSSTSTSTAEAETSSKKKRTITSFEEHLPKQHQFKDTKRKGLEKALDISDKQESQPTSTPISTFSTIQTTSSSPTKQTSLPQASPPPKLGLSMTQPLSTETTAKPISSLTSLQSHTPTTSTQPTSSPTISLQTHLLPKIQTTPPQTTSSTDNTSTNPNLLPMKSLSASTLDSQIPKFGANLFPESKEEGVQETTGSFNLGNQSSTESDTKPLFSTSITPPKFEFKATQPTQDINDKQEDNPFITKATTSASSTSESLTKDLFTPKSFSENTSKQSDISLFPSITKNKPLEVSQTNYNGINNAQTASSGFLSNFHTNTDLTTSINTNKPFLPNLTIPFGTANDATHKTIQTSNIFEANKQTAPSPNTLEQPTITLNSKLFEQGTNNITLDTMSPKNILDNNVPSVTNTFNFNPPSTQSTSQTTLFKPSNNNNNFTPSNTLTEVSKTVETKNGNKIALLSNSEVANLPTVANTTLTEQSFTSGQTTSSTEKDNNTTSIGSFSFSKPPNILTDPKSLENDVTNKTTNTLNFGTSDTAPKATFNFDSTATKATNTLFNFVTSSSSETTPKLSATLNFGSTAPTFSFGTSTSNVTTPKPTATFGFGSTDSNDSTNKTIPTFSFGTTASNDTTSKTTPTFKFGSTTTPTETTPKTTNTLFNFSSGTSNDTTPKSSNTFNFGSITSNDTTPKANYTPFNFISATSNDTAAKTANTLFNFGPATSNDTTTKTTSTLVNSGSTSLNDTRPKTTTAFNFDSTATPNNTQSQPLFGSPTQSSDNLFSSNSGKINTGNNFNFANNPFQPITSNFTPSTFQSTLTTSNIFLNPKSDPNTQRANLFNSDCCLSLFGDNKKSTSQPQDFPGALKNQNIPPSNLDGAPRSLFSSTVFPQFSDADKSKSTRVEPSKIGNLFGASAITNQPNTSNTLFTFGKSSGSS